VIRKNNAPTFKGEAYSVYRNQEVSGNILNNDSDLENDTLYVYPSELTTPTNAEFKLPKYGTISMSSNGDFTYVPNKDIGKGGEIKDTAIFFVSEFSKRPSKYCNKLFSYLDTVVITIKPYRIFVPEGFSPNNDGVNDFFVISSEVPLKMELSIYNRWGNLVYENKDYKNDWNGIPNKGLIVGGEGVPDGTYYIYYNVNEKEQEDFKYITISR
jgi:gliding motility-associated-like protein